MSISQNKKAANANGPMKIGRIKKILSVGAGNMGQQITLQSALYGYHVNLYSRTPQGLAHAMDVIREYAKKFISEGKVTQEKADKTLALISPLVDAKQAAQDVDLLIESIPEIPEQKTAVFSRFNTLCPEHTIFATNTSTLLPSMFSQISGRPDRFIALHFHTYVWTSNVVDIMPHAATSQETIEIVKKFSFSIGQIPVLIKKESHGYIFNAMMSALNTVALNLVANEVSTVKDIDLVWRGVMKMPIGPFGIMDHIGLDTIFEIMQYWSNETKDPAIINAGKFIKKYVDYGKLGIKTGEGFYSYKDLKNMNKTS